MNQAEKIHWKSIKKKEKKKEDMIGEAKGWSNEIITPSKGLNTLELADLTLNQRNPRG